MIVASGTYGNGQGTFYTKNGQEIVAQGNGLHWSGVNQQTGAIYDFTREPQNATWSGTRTNADGTDDMGQFTVFTQTEGNGDKTATICSFNRFDDGWKSLI